MILYVIITALTATSIILFKLFYDSTKSRRALERELSSIRAMDLEELKRQALKEIEEIKVIEKERLEAELREKRIQNDAEIKQKEEAIALILENYKKAGFQAVQNALLSAKEVAAQELERTKSENERVLIELKSRVAAESQILDQRRKEQIAITDALRRKALENDEHNIKLLPADKLEVNDLQAVATKYPRVRNIILKATYEIYYAPEVKKLISRVVGNGRVMGIYRITSKLDGRIYIGKSVDIKQRWTTHFKRAAGVESETTNLLYPAMRSQGLENFSFEIIEIVEDESLLSSREKYWQEFYDAKTHGFSVK